MLTVNDFISRYESYTDDELQEVYANINGYSQEAKDAFNIVIEKRGGLLTFEDNIISKRRKADETSRIRQEAAKLLAIHGENMMGYRGTLSSDMLTEEEIQKIIDDVYSDVQMEKKDKEVNVGTIMGSVTGGIIASLVCGGLLGLWMIQTHRIFYAMIAGIAIISYGIIRAFTTQSKKNIVVLIATIVSVSLSVILAQLLFSIFG